VSALISAILRRKATGPADRAQQEVIRSEQAPGTARTVASARRARTARSSEIERLTWIVARLVKDRNTSRTDRALRSRSSRWPYESVKMCLPRPALSGGSPPHPRSRFLLEAPGWETGS
jgi:hypothetical protein